MKYFTAHTLRSAAKEAARKKFNRQINLNEVETLLSSYPDWIRFPVMFDLLHNDSEMRCHIALSEKTNVWLDVTLDRYDALPDVPEESLA